MKKLLRSCLIALGIATLAIGASEAAPSVGIPDISRNSVFIENKGQWPSEVKFFAKAKGIDFWVTEKGLVYDISRIQSTKKDQNSALTNRFEVPEKMTKDGQVIRMDFESPEAGRSYIGKNLKSEYYNYFLGDNPKGWHSNVPAYESVEIQSLYQGVDAIISIHNGSPRYDFRIQAGVHPEKISFSYSGANNISLVNNEIVLGTILGNAYNGKMYAYQDINGLAKKVECNFLLIGNNIRFALGEFDKAHELIIDPMVYATFLGGQNDDVLTNANYSRTSEIIVTGWSSSSTYPRTTGSYSGFTFDADVVVSQIDGATSSLRFSTFIGGLGPDRANGIIVDNSGNILVCGETSSTAYPTTTNAVKETYSENIDAFVSKLSADGASLIYSTYLGGSELDKAYAVAVDKNDNIVVTGETWSSNYHRTTGAFDFSYNSGADVFVTKITSSTGTIAFSTFIGGGENDRAYAVYVDPSNSNITLAGETSSSSFPMPLSTTVTVYDKTHNGLSDIFLFKLASTGNTNLWSTFIGGDKNDVPLSMMVKTGGTIILGGYTESGTKFPKGSSALGAAVSGIDAFVAQVSSDAKNLLLTRLIGGNGTDEITSVGLDGDGVNMYATGYTNSLNFPVYGEAAQNKIGGSEDMFVLRISDVEILNSTYFGGKGADRANKILISSSKEAFIIGSTASDSLGTEAAYQPKYQGGASDGFVGKFVFANLELASPAQGSTYCAGGQLPIQWAGTGFATPQTYSVQIFKNNVWETLGSNISTSSYTYTIPSTIAGGDNYKIRVVSSSGLAVTSAQFTIGAAPKFSSQISNFSACVGEPASFTANATGGNLSYTWRKNGTAISGAKSGTLNFTDLKETDAGTYDVQVSNPCMSNVTSQPFTITIKPKTKITSQPQNANPKIGEPVSFTVSANGAGLSYEWQKDGAVIPGATTATFSKTSIADTDSGEYRVIVKGDCGSDTSIVAKLSINIVSVEEFYVSNGLKLEILNRENNFVAKVRSDVTGSGEIFVSDILGNKISFVHNGLIGAGESTYFVNMADQPSGVYYLIVRHNGNQVMHKFTITR